MTLQFRDIVDLLRTLIWPIVVLVLALAFRGELPGLTRSLSARLSKLSAAGFAIELVAAQPLEPAIQDNLASLREPQQSMPFGSDLARSLVDLIRQGAVADYAVIDLGSGKRWLTSRLYIFAQVLDRVLGVHALLFVQDGGNVSWQFAGLAQPGAVARALGARFPWLEVALRTGKVDSNRFYNEGPLKKEADALLEQMHRQPGPQFHELVNALARIVPGSLQAVDWSNPYEVEKLANAFLTNDQIRRKSIETPEPARGWIRLPQPADGSDQYDEHAEWIGGEPRLRRLLGSRLLTTASLEHAQAGFEDALIRSVTAQRGEYVALTDPHGRFERLIDVRSVLTAAVRRQIRG